jgi:SAM-dependent methyltransferase
MGQAKNRKVEIDAIKLSGDTYESKINRSKDRIRKNGEIFTPTALVRDVLNALPQDSFKDPKKTFLDPACGDGQFLIEVLGRKMEHTDPLTALKTTFGVDIMASNVVAARNRLVTYIMNNTVVVDTTVPHLPDLSDLVTDEDVKSGKKFMVMPGSRKDFQDMLYMIVSNQIKQADFLNTDVSKLFAR